MQRSASSRTDHEAAFVAVCRRLIRDYEVTGWWPAQSPFEVMVGAVLVQNTRWANVEVAITQLRHSGCLAPDVMVELGLTRLETLIRSAGCQSVKARRLKALVSWLEAAGGVGQLTGYATEALRQELLRVHGVGQETADAILCYAFGRPVFIADQYARSWMARMGWISAEQARQYQQCRDWAHERLADAGLSFQDLHAAIVLHGQSVCRRRPCCAGCKLQPTCRHGREYTLSS